MQETYFSKFPLVSYTNNSTAVNITERVVVRDFPAKNINLYYQYDLRNGERPDQIADRIYDDQYMGWIIYLSNGVTDPYYDWFIPDDVFNDFLIKKYGIDMMDDITSKVLYYRNNWYTDTESVISVSEYRSLPEISKQDLKGNTYLSTAKRYYDVVLTGRNITGFRRKQIDETHRTNRIVKYDVSGSGDFIKDEIVDITLGYQDPDTDVFVSTVSGQAQVSTSNSSVVTIQHTFGFVDSVPANYEFTQTSSTIVGRQSKTSKTITGYLTQAVNITESESIYWSPVTIYEHEAENNLKNKTIRLMDPGVAPQIADRISRALKAIL